LVPFCDPRQAYLQHRVEYDAAWQRVMASGRYILGPEVQAFEAEMAAACGSRFAIAVASGTSALQLILNALEIGSGDLVLLPSHTAVATAAAVRGVGATPVWVEVAPQSFTVTVDTLEASLAAVRHAGWEKRVRAVIAVHLYGHPADPIGLRDLCERAGIALIEDCAQAHGATVAGEPVGSIGIAGAFSFYPTKNMPAFGDGGAVVTSDPALAERLRSLRQYGWRQRYVSEEVGTNSRLDEVQAALLRVSLQHLADWNARRVRVADHYDAVLRSTPVILPGHGPGVRHVFHQYVIRTDQRDRLAAHLATADVQSAVLYPQACHQQPAYRTACPVPIDLRKTEEIVRSLLCLPIFPQITDDQIQRTSDIVLDFYSDTATE